MSVPLHAQQSLRKRLIRLDQVILDASRLGEYKSIMVAAVLFKTVDPHLKKKPVTTTSGKNLYVRYVFGDGLHNC